MAIQILLVDDDPLCLELVTRSANKVLYDLAYEVTWCQQVSESIRILRDKTFDLIICDYKMPESRDGEIPLILNQLSDSKIIVLSIMDVQFMSSALVSASITVFSKSLDTVDGIWQELPQSIKD